MDCFVGVKTFVKGFHYVWESCRHVFKGEKVSLFVGSCFCVENV